jgi:hypothetical protein
VKITSDSENSALGWSEVIRIPRGLREKVSRGRERGSFPCSRADLGQNWPNTIHYFSFSFYWQIRKFVETSRKLVKS